MKDSFYKEEQVRAASAGLQAGIQSGYTRHKRGNKTRVATEGNNDSMLKQTLQPNSKGFSHQAYFYTQPQSKSRMNKQPEELYEENMHLKLSINKLTKQLSLQRGKVEIQKRKNHIYSKQLDRQFQRENLWHQNYQPNSYIITGVKHQYQKLKEHHKEVCQQLQKLKKSMLQTQISQLSTYCETLQEQNQQLTHQLKVYLDFDETESYFKSRARGNENIKVMQFQLLEDRSTIERLQDQKDQKDARIKQLQQKLRQSVRKYDFLEKVIFQKDNSEHMHRRKSTKLCRQNTELKKQILLLKNQAQQIQKKQQIELQEYKLKEEKKAETERKLFKEALAVKDFKIAKLQKQIGYLSTLLSEWRPAGSNQKEQQEDSFLMINTKTETEGCRQLALSQGVNQSNVLESETQINAEQKIIEKEEPFNYSRKPFTAYQRNSQKGVKVRKITLSDVEEFAQELRYRLVGHSVSVEEMKQLFTFHRQENISSAQNKWKTEYISMQEARKILRKHPFQMAEGPSLKLARYLIEDCSEQYVYCDDINENSRSVVKSIILALLGHGEPPIQQTAQNTWIEIKKGYGYNLQLALKSMCPKGLISKAEFQELFSSLGIDIDKATLDWLIGSMVIKSNSINKLSYPMLFDSNQDT